MHRPAPSRSACKPRHLVLGWIALLLGLVFLTGTIAYLPSATHSWIVTTVGLAIAALGFRVCTDPRARAHGTIAIVCGLLGTLLLAAHAYLVQSSLQTSAAPGVQQVAASPAARAPHSPAATASAPATVAAVPAQRTTTDPEPSAITAVRAAMLSSLQQVRDRLDAYRGTLGDWPDLTMNSDGMISIASGDHAGTVLGYAPANMTFLYSRSSDGVQFSARLVSMKYTSESVLITSQSTVASTG